MGERGTGVSTFLPPVSWVEACLKGTALPASGQSGPETVTVLKEQGLPLSPGGKLMLLW